MPPVERATCADGGWWLTPAGQLRVLRAYLAGRIVPPATRRLMEEQCLGWDCQAGGLRTALLLTNGLIIEAGAVIATLFGVLGGRVPVVGAVNSQVTGGETIVSLAEAEATVG